MNKKLVKSLSLDLIGVVGLVGVSFGVYQIYQPLAPIVAGSFLMIFAYKASI